MKVQTAVDIGEQGLIRRLRDTFPQLGMIGDDSAVLKEIRCPLVTTDSFFEGSHFYRWWAPGDILGRRILEASLSDIAAMGGRSVCAFAAVTVPPELEVEWIVEFYRGLTERADCVIAGGETVRGSVFGITLTVVGEGGDPETLLRRSDLKPGDLIWVSGSVGRALDAPEMLHTVGGLSGSELLPVRGEIDSEHLEQLRAFIEPRAQLELGARSRELGVRCGIDISDGLLSEATHLARESGVDVIVEIDASFLFDSVRDRPLEASTAGEDFVLLLGAEEGIDLTCQGCFPAGYAEKGSGELRVMLEGRPVEVGQTGFDHLEG